MNSKGIDCLGDNGVCIPVSTHSVKSVKKHTNADRLRSMNDEELAEFLESISRDYNISYGEYFSTKAGDFIFSKKDLAKEILKWLQSEAE